MGLFVEGLKSVLLGKRYGDRYLQSNRFKEAIFELKKSHNYKIKYVTALNPRQWSTVDNDIDVSEIESACLWVYPNETAEAVIVLSKFYASGAVTLKMEELGQVGDNFNKKNYIFELDYYLFGGDYQVANSPFEIIKEVLSQTKKLKTLQAK